MVSLRSLKLRGELISIDIQLYLCILYSSIRAESLFSQGLCKYPKVIFTYQETFLLAIVGEPDFY